MLGNKLRCKLSLLKSCLNWKKNKLIKLIKENQIDLFRWRWRRYLNNIINLINRCWFIKIS